MRAYPAKPLSISEELYTSGVYPATPHRTPPPGILVPSRVRYRVIHLQVAEATGAECMPGFSDIVRRAVIVERNVETGRSSSV